MFRILKVRIWFATRFAFRTVNVYSVMIEAKIFNFPKLDKKFKRAYTQMSPKSIAKARQGIRALSEGYKLLNL